MGGNQESTLVYFDITNNVNEKVVKSALLGEQGKIPTRSRICLSAIPTLTWTVVSGSHLGNVCALYLLNKAT